VVHLVEADHLADGRLEVSAAADPEDVLGDRQQGKVKHPS